MSERRGDAAAGELRNKQLQAGARTTGLMERPPVGGGGVKGGQPGVFLPSGVMQDEKKGVKKRRRKQGRRCGGGGG